MFPNSSGYFHWTCFPSAWTSWSAVMTGIWPGFSLSIMLLITKAQCLTVAGVFTESESNGRSWLIDLLLTAVAILQWNAANEIRSSTSPAEPCSFCNQSDALLATSCWDGNSYKLIFNSNGSGFPPLVSLMSVYKDGILSALVDVVSNTNANGGCWMESSGCWKMEINVPWKDEVAVLDNKLWLGRADYSVVVVFSAQLIRTACLNIFNLLVSYTEPFRGNFID